MSEFDLGQKLPDEPEAPANPDIESLSDEEIEAQIQGLSRDEPEEVLADDMVVEESAETLEVPTEEPTETPVEDQVTEEVPVEPTAADLDAQLIAAREEKLRADLEYQQSHSSRLAGEIGHLKTQIKELNSRQPETEFGSDADDESPLLRKVMSRLDAIESSRAEPMQAQVDGAIAAAVQSHPASADLQTYQAEVHALSSKYVDDFRMAQEAGSPEVARQLAHATVSRIVADAKETHILNLQKTARERAKTRAEQVQEEKLRSAATASGPQVRSSAKSKSVDSLSETELDAVIDRSIASG